MCSGFFGGGLHRKMNFWLRCFSCRFKLPNRNENINLYMLFFFIPTLSFHFCSPVCCIIQCFHGYINQFIELQLAVFNYKIPFHEIEETPHRTIWVLFLVFVECVFGLYGLFASIIVFFFSSV